MFTVSETGLTPALRRCLGTTNVMDNAHAGMRCPRGHVTRWRDGSRAAGWAAAAFLDAENNYRRVLGYKDSGCSRRTWTTSALPRLTERRLPRSMNQPGATATSNYVWDSF